MKKTMLFLASFAVAASAMATAVSVNLGNAGDFTALAETGISTGPSTTITGNIGVYPAAASYITGFSLIADSSNQFSTSALLRGRAYAANYSPPTPSFLDTAIGNMQTAYTAAAGEAPDVVETSGTVSGSTFAPGVYKWSSNVDITSSITLAGTAQDIWVFQISGTLTLESGVNVTLSGGAQASNIFWQVAGQTTLGTTSVLNGNVLDQTAIVFDGGVNTGATLNGKALAQTAVTFATDCVAISSTNGYIGPTPPGVGKVFAYPSPARGNVINIVYTMNDSGTAHIRIYNTVGDLVASTADLKQAGVQTSQLQIGGFAPGIYIYKVVLNYDSGASDRLGVQKFGVSK